MIEDDDTFKQNEGLEPLGEDKRHPLFYLYLVILWIIWTVILSVIFIPRVRAAVRESGVVELIEASGEKESVLKTRDVSVAYLTDRGFEIFELTTRRRGSDSMHDAIEALIHDYPEEAVLAGGLSLLNEKAELIGLTESEGIVYVNFSKAFLTSESWNGYTASDQVRATLMNFKGVEKVVILVEGEVQNL